MDRRTSKELTQVRLASRCGCFGSTFLLDWVGGGAEGFEASTLFVQSKLDPETLGHARTTIWKQLGAGDRFELC
jgi:hypothetical protein